MGKTSKRGRVIVVPTKTCYPKAEPVKPCHYTYTIGPTKTYRLKSDLDREKQRKDERDADVATNVLVGLLFMIPLFMLCCLLACLSNG